MKEKQLINIRNGNVIKNYRETNNLSQVELGFIVGVSSKTISKWERGKATISKTYLDILKNRLKLKDLQYPENIVKFDRIECKRQFGTLRGPYKRNTKQKVNHIIHEKQRYNQAKTNRRRLYVDVIKNLPYLTRFGGLLKDIRYNQNLTLESMASKLDLGASHLWKLEQGEAITIRISTIKGLIDMGVSIDDLFMRLQ